MKLYQKISLAISILACINIGIEGVFHYNFLEQWMINIPTIVSIIYVFIGVTGMLNILLYDLNRQDKEK